MGKRTYKFTEQEFLQHVGDRIQRYRVSKKSCTQEHLAESIDSNSSYISKVENGQAGGLTLRMAASLANALDVPLAELLDIEDEHASSHSDKRMKRLLAKAHTLNDHNRAIVLDLFESMIDRFNKPTDLSKP